MNELGMVDELGDPRMVVRLRGLSGVELQISAIVDTGFAGSLSIPPEMAASLGLKARDRSVYTLADGSLCEVATHVGEVEWFGKWRRCDVIAMGEGVLLGMRLLHGRRLEMDAVEGGVVRVGSISTVT